MLASDTVTFSGISESLPPAPNWVCDLLGLYALLRSDKDILALSNSNSLVRNFSGMSLLPLCLVGVGDAIIPAILGSPVIMNIFS